MVFSLFATVLSSFRRVLRVAGGRSSPVRASNAVSKSSAAAASKARGDAPRPAAAPDDPPASRVRTENSFLFRRLQRPTLVERTAADVSLEEARAYAAQAEKFYTQPFSLFARSDFFYEEVEQEYLDDVLGRHTHAADMNFLGVMTVFRKTLNANTRRLLLVYAPLLLLGAVSLLLASGAGLAGQVTTLTGAGDMAARAAVTGGVFFLAMGFLMLLYHWPYKVTQQQNLLGLDNYITSKFSRINQNFQVAKRRAMNVERTMRMPQADELRDEAGTWTLAYNWLAMRLLLCELTVRNAVYQIRRNTTLYGVAGATLCLLVGVSIIFVERTMATSVSANGWLMEAAVFSGAFVVAGYGAVMAKATADTLSVLQPDEWNRFHHVDLHESIRDHVGEDKLQIVTFRDRNRLE